jgi:hypothetical protein
MEGITTPFCPGCGKAIPAGSIFCNYCGVRLPTERELMIVEPPRDWAASQPHAPSSTIRPRGTGSIGLGVLAGFLLLFFIGFIPIIGALIAGIVSGLIARGAARGAIAGFVAGIFRSVILAILISFLGAAIGGILGLAGFGGLLGGLVGGSFVLLSLGSAIVCLIGGLIGGALRRG